jgi:hypothetical protein
MGDDLEPWLNLLLKWGRIQKPLLNLKAFDTLRASVLSCTAVYTVQPPDEDAVLAVKNSGFIFALCTYKVAVLTQRRTAHRKDNAYAAFLLHLRQQRISKP